MKRVTSVLFFEFLKDSSSKNDDHIDRNDHSMQLEHVNDHFLILTDEFVQLNDKGYLIPINRLLIRSCLMLSMKEMEEVCSMIEFDRDPFLWQIEEIHPVLSSLN